MAVFDYRKQFVQKTIGRCLTEYSHPCFDELVQKCTGFITTSLGGSIEGKQIRLEPRCGAMEELYGMLKNSDKVLLKYIIDSSD